MKIRSFLILALGVAAMLSADAQAIRRNPGFTSHSVARNDDGSSQLEPLGFTINLFGKIRTAAYVNNNGNLTFDSSLSTFTPFGLRGTEREIIAPFFADVDTRPEGSNLVTFGMDTVNGHRAFAANYIDVGYYSQHTDKLNSFQVVLIEREDQGPGDFDIEFNYERIAWETGDASGGVNGFGGTPAAAGWSNGSDTSYELPGSLQRGAFLDGGPYSLVRQSITGAVVNTSASQATARPGRLVFRARDGVISPGLVISGGQLPEATVGVPYSEAATVKGADPPFRWTLQADVAPPPGLSFSSNGVLSGTPTAPGTYGFTLGVTGNSEDGEITVYERGSITIRQAALRITTTCPLPGAIVGGPYGITMAAQGFSGNVLWSVRDPLPPGLGLSPSGQLAGTPQVPGTYPLNFEVRAADGSAAPAQLACKLEVTPGAIRLGSSCMLPRATVGVPFSQMLVPSGGFAPYQFQLTGDLPQGVGLLSDGRIAGTPMTSGGWPFKITTTDDHGEHFTQDCWMIVDAAQFSTSVCPLPSGETGIPYSTNLGNGFTWSIVGNLPGGLSLSPNGVLSGTPMTAGAAQFGLLATNAQNQQSMEACSLIIQRGALSVGGCPLPDARVGQAYDVWVTGQGGQSPYLFSTVAGALPPGLTLLSSGRISGTPTGAGEFPFTLRLRDGSPASTTQACKVTVKPAELQLTSSCPLPDAHVGEPYSFAVAIAGGRAPYQLSFGTLPDGLTGSAAGVVSGTPTRLGGRTFPIRVTDAAGGTLESVCSLNIARPQVPAISLVDPPATVAAASSNVALTVQLAEPYTAPVRGTMNLEITPLTAGTDPVVNTPDPLLAFANGQRSAPFTIPAGSRSVNVPLVSTGTVASNVAVRLTNLEASGAPLAQTPGVKFFRLPPAAPTVSSACYVRTNTERGVQLDLRITGISNTRELTSAKITVPGLSVARPNLPVPEEYILDSGNTVRVDLESIAFAYYSTATNVRTGGSFSLNVPLSLETEPTALAPTAKIEGITIEVANKAGSAAGRTVSACP